MAEPLINERCERCGDGINSHTPIHGNTLGVVGNEDPIFPLTTGHGHTLAFHVVEASWHAHHRNQDERLDAARQSESKPQKDISADNVCDMEGQASTDNNGGGDAAAADSKFLAVIFALFVAFGTCNAVMGKMIMIPMVRSFFSNVAKCILSVDQLSHAHYLFFVDSF
jgi:hypothetical protein